MDTEIPNLSPLQRIKELDAERDKLFSQAKSAALIRAKDAVTELNALGCSFDLIEGTAGKRKQKRSKGGPCSVCSFATTPAHDARRHRFQGTNKQAFTVDELSELGLARV